MNRVTLIGRLVKDPETTNVKDGMVHCSRYTIAVDRRTGDNEADYIPCVAFGKLSDFAKNYLHKGMKIGVAGRIQSSSYVNKDGQRIFTINVIVEEHEFCERNDKKRNE